MMSDKDRQWQIEQLTKRVEVLERRTNKLEGKKCHCDANLIVGPGIDVHPAPAPLAEIRPLYIYPLAGWTPMDDNDAWEKDGARIWMGMVDEHGCQVQRWFARPSGQGLTEHRGPFVDVIDAIAAAMWQLTDQPEGHNGT